jgi:hypothetical protein
MNSIPLFDQNGNVIMPTQPQRGYAQPAPPPHGAQARVQMPDVPDMAGRQPGKPSWYRMAFFPTAPFYSTDPQVGYQPRYYSTGITSTDADYAIGTEALRIVQYDLPCRLIANNAAAIDVITPALLIDGGRNAFLFREEYTVGDKLHVSQRLGDTVTGSASRPGQIGATGYTINGGASMIVGITPLFLQLRVDVSLHCLEMRGARNFTPPG